MEELSIDYKLYNHRWAIVALYWIVIFSYGANWFSLSPMLKTFESNFGVEPWVSHLLISLIGMFVIFFAWPAGALIDRRGPKISTSIGALFMALGFGLRPWLLGSFSTLLISSIIAGIGLGWILVALAPQMLRWFPQKQASLPVGIAASGLFIGFGTGSLSMPILVSVTSMFNSFLIFGIISIITFLLWIALARDSPPTPPEVRKKVEKMKFVGGMKHILSSKNAYIYPFIGFFIVGITLVISAFLPKLYPGTEGGYISGLLLYGCAIGAFIAPSIVKKVALKKVTLSVIIGAIIFWITIFVFNYYYNLNWLFIIPIAFIFGFCLQASWPIALYSQETEEGVTEANFGIAASLYISVSNIGAAILPVIFPIIFKNDFSYFIAILIGIIICLLLWGIVKRK